MHAQTVCTRPFPLLLLKGPGDEAKNPHAWGMSQVDPDLTSTCHVVALPNTDGWREPIAHNAYRTISYA